MLRRPRDTSEQERDPTTTLSLSERERVVSIPSPIWDRDQWRRSWDAEHVFVNDSAFGRTR